MLAWTAASGASAQAEAPGKERSAASEARFAELVREALDHFRQGHFEAAAREFEAAIEIAPNGIDVGTLEFNAATSEYELQHFAEAERRFIRLAARDPELSALARLNAGMAALRDGRTQDAKNHLHAAPAGGDEATARHAELAALIAIAEQADGVRAFESAWHDGVSAYSAGDAAQARRALEQALALEAHGQPTARARVRLVLGYLDRDRGDLAAAHQRFTQAISLDPSNGEAYVARAEVALRGADYDAAEFDALHALALRPSEAVADRAHATLQALDVLPARGPKVTVAMGIGWDSNASQSGSAAASELIMPAGTTASPFGSASLQVEYVTRLSRKRALSPYYSGDLFIPTERSLQALSLQVHELGAQLQFAFRPDLRLSVRAGAVSVLSGWQPVRALSVEGVLAARLAAEQSTHSTLVAELSARPVLGLSGQDYLTGVRVDGLLEERLSLGIARLSVEAGYRYNGIGTETIPADPSRFRICSLRTCGDLDYIVPLGYQAPLAGAFADFQLAEQLWLGAGARLEYRFYNAPNAVAGLDDTAVLRHDLRTRVQAHAQWNFDSAGRYSLIVNYDMLMSDSNMAQGTGGSAHRFDYANRNFVQHVVETDAVARF
jgi:tetratricopeptide (TPR) repeat protein